MGSREDILNAVKRNKPTFTPAPVIPPFEIPQTDLVQHFSEVLAKVGGEAVIVNSQAQALDLLTTWTKEYNTVASTVSWANVGNLNLATVQDPHTIEHLDLAILEGHLGVAENAAIWITEKEAVHRAVPFITQYLVLVIQRPKIIWNMHQAYNQIQITHTNYGVFVAGPSKTADIEQSLVVGAHGPRSLRVIIYG